MSAAQAPSSEKARPSASPIDFVFEVIDFVTGLGILTMSMSPLAVPCLALIIVPGMVLGLVGALAVAVLSLPLLLVRGAAAAARRARTSRGRGASAGAPRPVRTT